MSTNHSSPLRARLGRRLAVTGTVLAIVLLAGSAPASAAINGLTVGSQAGVLNAGTAGAVNYQLVLSRSGTFFPGNGTTVSWSVTGLPTGASAGNFVALGNWSGSTRNYQMTVNTTAATPGGSTNFTVQASAFFSGSTSSSGTLTIQSVVQPQTITFAPLPDKVYGGADFAVNASASSGLPVSFAAAGNCTVTAAMVHLAGAGPCTITASQPGNASYLPAPDVPRSFTVNPGDQTIAFGPLQAKATIEPDFTVSAAASSGLAVSFAATGVCTISGASVHLTGAAGSCTITASQTGNTNYNAAPNVPQTFTVIAPTHEIYAVTGSTTLDGLGVTVWGYNTSNTPVTKPGGPVLTATVGQPVALAFHNQLSEASSVVIRGQDLPTDQTGAPASGGISVYTFTPTEPGTYIYEAGPLANAQHQVAMGLYGVLVVNAGPPVGESVIVISEIDPALSNSATPATFDMRNYAPKYTLINGVVYPTANAVLGTVAPGGDFLVRYVNAGINYHSMSVLGADQRIVADDGHALPHPYTVVAQTVGPGQTTDAVVHASATAAANTMLTVFDASLQIRNRNRRPATATATVTYGGALGFIAIDGTPGTGDTVGPVASNLVATTTSISASISDATTGNSNVDAADFTIDGGAPIAFTGTFGSPTVSVSETFAALSPGSHTIRVRGHDSSGNYGLYASVVVSTDNQGPLTTGLALTPNPSNGLVQVALHATGSDTATGGSAVAAAEYRIDGGSPVGMTVSPPGAVTASLDAAISAGTVLGLVAGPHPVAVRAQDSAGNWGGWTTIDLIVDKSGPTTSGVAAAPNPNNGTLGVNSSIPAVRVTATATDTNSTIERAEGFIDSVAGGDGAGFPFVPTDGTWNSSTESMSVDIPLTTISSLGAGNHIIYVHAKDKAGNWGPMSTTTLVIDKTAPTASSINRLDPTPTAAASVRFLVTFSEAVTGVTSANFSTAGSAPGTSVTSSVGTGTTRTVTVSTGTGGGTLGLDLTTAAGIKDIAGNSLSSTGLPFVGQVYTVVSPPLYFSTFGNSNPPSVGGTADDADIYLWGGASFSRVIDASTLGVPGGANVDGFDRVDDTHFYMSFTGNVTIAIPGPDLSVADEDVVYYNAGTWSLWFDGSANGVAGTDLDAISIVGGTMYFSTDNTTVPPGSGGTGDDADIYRWNGGSSYTRVIDASDVGWSGANVDGLVWVDATHVYLSYSVDATVPVLGAVQDEDVVYYNAGVWSVYFDGTSKGLTSGNLDIDAFDLP